MSGFTDSILRSRSRIALFFKKTHFLRRIEAIRLKFLQTIVVRCNYVAQEDRKRFAFEKYPWKNRLARRACRKRLNARHFGKLKTSVIKEKKKKKERKRKEEEIEFRKTRNGNIERAGMIFKTVENREKTESERRNRNVRMARSEGEFSKAINKEDLKKKKLKIPENGKDLDEFF